MYDKDIVAKWVQLDTNDYSVEYLTERLLHEAQVYERLKPLQGVYVPELVAHGPWRDGSTYVLVTSLVDGRQLDVEEHPEDAELVESGEGWRQAGFE